MIFFQIIFSTVLTANAATTPDLGVAFPYGVLTDNTFTATTTTINGDVGYTTLAGTPLTVSGATNAANAAYDAAIIAKDAAKAAIDAEACDFSNAAAVDLFGDTTHTAGGFGPLNVYYPGVYCITGAISQTGNITLSGTGTYIFRTPVALSSAASVSILLADGALASDVFWRAG
jgi:hypothetical protein